jgi:uroporphyrinogen decarboxylase
MTQALKPVERLRLAIEGGDVDRSPVSLWRHFPERDQTAADLAALTHSWQGRFDCDFVKFMPPGDYAIIDWGAESVFEGALGGTRTTTHFPIMALSDWTGIAPLDVSSGFNGMVLDAIRATKAQLRPDVPLLQTIFSPLTIAMKMSNGVVLRHLEEDSATVHGALKVITQTTRAMLLASLEHGADGVFFASQCADRTVMSELGYREHGLPYDETVLRPWPESAPLLIHLHGAEPMLDLALEFPPGLLNWHDRFAGPPLAEGHAQTDRPVAGGINEKTIATATIDAVVDDVLEAIRAMNGRSLAITPGCVIPTNTPDEHVDAVVRTVREWKNGET